MIKSLPKNFHFLIFIFFFATTISYASNNLDVDDVLVFCQEQINIALDTDGTAAIGPEHVATIIGASTDLDFITVAPNFFDCDDIGINFTYTVTWSEAGVVSSCIGHILVEDKIEPTAICVNDLIIDLAGNPSVFISPLAIDAGSYDNCSVDLSLSQSTFTLADLGDNIINMTVTDDGGNSNSCITTIQVVNNVSDYCIANGGSTSREFIKKIKFRVINNFSGDNGGYADFTSMEARVRRGRRYNIRLKPGFHGSRRRQHWRIWIDWNQNQVFEASEKVAQGRSKFNITRSIDVPVTAIPGTTRMRVMMKRGSYGNPCAVFAKGEVEDYSVYVRPIAPALISQESSDDEISMNESFAKTKENTAVNLFPNPVSDVLNINLSKVVNGHLSVYNSLGNLVYEQALDQEFNGTLKLPTTHFNSGTYILLIQSEEGREAYSFIVVK